MDSFDPWMPLRLVRHLLVDEPWSVPLTEHVRILKQPPYRLFHRTGIVLHRVNLGRPEDERYTLVMLLGDGWVTERCLAEVYSYHVNSLSNWRRR